MIIEWKKRLFLPSLWSDDMDIEIIEIFTLEVLTNKVVHFDQLRHWQKTDVNGRLLIDFF